MEKLHEPEKLDVVSYQKKYDDLVTALFKGEDNVSTKTEVTYEDGKKGYLEATLKLVDSQTYMLKPKSDAA